jgi:cell division protein FtsZ
MTGPLYTEPDPQIRQDLPILFLAVGHAGIQLISHLSTRVPELKYAAVDTDAASLEGCPFDQKLLMGEASGGMGSGGDRAKASDWMLEEEGRVRALMQEVRLVLVVAGLGGGTGGGIGVRLVEAARDMGKIVISALVQPLEVEGPTVRNRADAALTEFREVSHAVMLFPLEALKKQEAGPTLSRLLKLCGVEVGRSIGGLAMLLRSGWLLPLTLQDVVEVMQRADGYCRLLAVSSDADDRVDQVLEKLFSHVLIDQGSLLAHSGGIVVGILCGPGTPLEDIERISREIRQVLRSDAEVKFAVAQDERFGRYLGLVVMVAERWATVLASPEAAEVAGEASTEESGGSPELVQGEIDLTRRDPGRFKDIQPTIEEGADLDTPTYIRKGLKLSFHKARRE